MKKKILLISLLLLIPFCACQEENAPLVENSNSSIFASNNINSYNSTLPDNNTINPNNEQKNTDIGSVEIFTEDEELNEFIKESVTISSNEKIEKAEWIEDNVCYRISVERKFDVEGEYGHIRDYIMVKDESFKCVEITYPSKNDSVNSDRYVYDACNFEINYIDVTFDGNKDIVISLGHQGAAGTCISCAYIYEDGEYKYVKSFENIPNYSLNNEEQFINGCFKDTEYKYIYTNGQFVELNDAKTYEN